MGGSRLASTRECRDRLGLIVNHLPQRSCNVLDIGSNTGYYLFELARLGYFCHGIDSDPELVCYASLMAYLTECSGVSCEVGKLDLAFIERMPSYDVILCLSVMHHIILAEGMEIADSILQQLVTKTNEVLFFEMGQSNEIDADWSGRLPRMEPDPETWISQWLVKSGFRYVKTIGTSHTTVSRFLFAAYP
jgi:SAM-dependent methyltransferase